MIRSFLRVLYYHSVSAPGSLHSPIEVEAGFDKLQLQC